MEFSDIKAQQLHIREGIDRRITKVLDHGRYIMGPEVNELENNLASFAGTKHAISCSSGTDAILMSLMAIGLRPGDLVFTPSFTFIASAEVISLLGATPCFVDIDPDTFNINPASLREAIFNARKAGNGRLKGIIAVDLFGLLADYPAIRQIADENDLVLLQDAAQSFGAQFGEERAGACAPIATTSFFPSKPLGCYGDAGAIFCNDDDFATVLRSIRVHGSGKNKYENLRIGVNGRCDTIQAAILLEKLRVFQDEINKRQMVAARYAQRLSKKYHVQKVTEGHLPVWAQFSLLSENRDQDRIRLERQGIPTAVYYPIPLHHQKAFANSCYCPVQLTASEHISTRILSLPMHPYLTESVQDHVIDTLLNE